MGRLRTVQSKVKPLGSKMPESSGTWRSGKTTAERGYGAKWQRARARFLGKPENVLCRMCSAEGVTVLATVVDHIVPHRGDQDLFWSEANWQPLCAAHHSADKQRAEAGGVL